MPSTPVPFSAMVSARLISYSRHIDSTTQTSPQAKKHVDALAATTTPYLQPFEALRQRIPTNEHEKENIPVATDDIFCASGNGARPQPCLRSHLAAIIDQTASKQHQPSTLAVQSTDVHPLPFSQYRIHNPVPQADPASLPLLEAALAETQTYLRETARSAIDEASTSLARALASATQALRARQATHASDASRLHAPLSETRFVVTSNLTGGAMLEVTLNARIDALRATLREERAAQTEQWCLHDEVESALAALPGECMAEIAAVREVACLECQKVMVNMNEECASVIKDVRRWEEKYAKIKDRAKAMVAKAMEELGQDLDDLRNEAEDAPDGEGSEDNEEQV